MPRPPRKPDPLGSRQRQLSSAHGLARHVAPNPVSTRHSFHHAIAPSAQTIPTFVISFFRRAASARIRWEARVGSASVGAPQRVRIADRLTASRRLQGSYRGRQVERGTYAGVATAAGASTRPRRSNPGESDRPPRRSPGPTRAIQMSPMQSPALGRLDRERTRGCIAGGEQSGRPRLGESWDQSGWRVRTCLPEAGLRVLFPRDREHSSCRALAFSAA